MSSLVIGPNKERLEFSINQVDLLASTNQEIVAPFTGFFDFMEVIVQTAVTTGGTLTVNAGGTFVSPELGLDATSFVNQNTSDGLVQVTAGLSATVTITIAAPGVISWANHGLPVGAPVVFTTTSALPTGITASTQYYVAEIGYGPNSFSVAATPPGAPITTSGSQSGTQTATAGQLGTTPVAGGVITIPNSATKGTVYSATFTKGDPSTLISQGSPIVIVPASFATAGAVTGFIQFRSQRV